MERKSNHPIMKKWDNIVYAHFLYCCFPLQMLENVRQLNISIDWLEVNEQFVVALFLKLHHKLGFPSITNIKTSYPDAEVKDSKGSIKHIEFEFKSSSFIAHETKIDKCDIIVCWEDDLSQNWKEKYPNLKIIELKEKINQI